VEFDNWFQRYEQANAAMENRDKKCMKIISVLERNMKLLGVTGVEDLLQEDIRSTLESIRQAGIAVWMLTGDKIETATCIGISAGIKSND
jgi:phospholipid-translocating ATPase